MPREFNVGAPRSTFLLPALTKQQIKALMLDLDCGAGDVIELAVAQLWQREIGEPERDIVAELDELRQRVEALEK